MSDWKPSCDLAALRGRAQLLNQIRDFFAQRHVLEVETPVLGRYTVTDVHIDSFAAGADSFAAGADSFAAGADSFAAGADSFAAGADSFAAGADSLGENTGPTVSGKRYLQTSPEYFMKRLLAAHGEAIFQVSKVFRVDPVARYHNPEFTMLEWYQPNYGLADLMDEVEALVLTVLGGRAIPCFSYAEVFQQQLGIDPHRVSPSELDRAFRQHVDSHGADLTATDQLQLLLDQLIIPRLPARFFLTEYPEPQAALARTRLDENGNRLAQRFELFCQGIEIANGYEELRDQAEQQRRFSADQQARAVLNKPVYPVDERLLAALDSGLPPCSGVALGVDRLLMLKLGAERIEEVLSFDASRA